MYFQPDSRVKMGRCSMRIGRWCVATLMVLVTEAFAESSGSILLPALTQNDAQWDEWADEAAAPQESPFHWRGFVEGLAGGRVYDNPVIDNDMTAAELRARVEVDGYWNELFASVKVDGVVDQVTEEETLDLREAYLQLPVSNQADLKLGRQVLTWGTGDLLFLNDLFPKDWQAFFAGRDMEYLKAPSDAVKVSYFTEAVNIDLVWFPVFNEDHYLTGQRFSYFSSMSNGLQAAPPELSGRAPENNRVSDEFALRIFRQWHGLEVAAYGYHGYFRQPLGFDMVHQSPYFPEMNSAGVSLRGPIERAIVNFETAYYDAADNRNGSNPLLPHSQWRALLGAERELVSELTASIQLYVEKMEHYTKYKSTTTNQRQSVPEWRQVYTFRLTEQRLRGNWTNSLFLFYSPSDRDYFLLPSISYRYSDHLQTELGARVFGGHQPQTFFAQFEENSNVYLRLRYSF